MRLVLCLFTTPPVVHIVPLKSAPLDIAGMLPSYLLTVSPSGAERAVNQREESDLFRSSKLEGVGIHRNLREYFKSPTCN